MFLVSNVVNLYARLAGPKGAFDIRLGQLLRWRTFEPEYYLLDHFVDPDCAAVDVGGNEGFYAGRLAQLCPRVHCFEPIPWMAADLRGKLRANVTVHEAAVSDRVGSVELRIPYVGSVQQHGTSTISADNPLEGAERVELVSCRMTTLDAAVSERVGFIKVDVEGHELAVLQGAAGLIARDRPVLLVESEKRHSPGAPEDVIGFMRGLGYGGMFLVDGTWHALSGFRSEVHQKRENLVGVRKVGTYVNNFVFLPE